MFFLIQSNTEVRKGKMTSSAAKRRPVNEKIKCEREKRKKRRDEQEGKISCRNRRTADGVSKCLKKSQEHNIR